MPDALGVTRVTPVPVTLDTWSTVLHDTGDPVTADTPRLALRGDDDAVGSGARMVGPSEEETGMAEKKISPKQPKAELKDGDKASEKTAAARVSKRALKHRKMRRLGK